ncbi:MAG: radical SAM protein, partial [Myxococcales bacterium]|nr:radical SAM protein [Myxococcales bacterium]
DYRRRDDAGRPTRHDDVGRPGSLDDLPSPYLMGLVEVETKTLYVETDRGCPYSCAFCVESTAPNKVSQFSMDRVEAELRWALERGFEHIEMCSAIFNRDSDWLEQFVELVERLDPKRSLSFSAALYSNYVDERQVALLRRLELKSALFGLNSTNSETFKSVRRVIRLEQFRKRMELIGQFMRPEVSLIMGLPGDTPEGFAKTLAFADTLAADVMIFRFMVLPATLYYEQRERYALEIDFANDNRILSTHSYSREDFAEMEAIARAAGYEEVNPGQWSKRRDQGMEVAAMDKRTWNFLYLCLRALGLDAVAWPAPWRFDRVLLEVERYAQIRLRDDRNNRGLDLLVSRRDDASPRFAHSGYFNVAYRESGRSQGDGEDPSLRPLLEGFTAGLTQAERTVLDHKRSERRS